MSFESTEDKAIKKSANDVPPYVPRRSAQRATGEHAQAVIDSIKLPYNPRYDHVHVIDYPAFDPAYDWYRVNFYYSHDEDPTTRITSFIVLEKDVNYETSTDRNPEPGVEQG